ncbi:hypothetical protein HGRIS_005415 [Hohenbuehelia grisea]|uniref:Uncharacterized protein n=1 Tax=Hohenbuehelia grisea TaxID=104357 RepID=A0ABR3JFU1_9AGAR
MAHQYLSTISVITTITLAIEHGATRLRRLGANTRLQRENDDLDDNLAWREWGAE